MCHGLRWRDCNRLGGSAPDAAEPRGSATVTSDQLTAPASSKNYHAPKLLTRLFEERGRQAQWRPCKLEAEPLKDVAEWVEHYRRFWEESFDRLEEYLQELQAKEQEPQNSREK